MTKSSRNRRKERRVQLAIQRIQAHEATKDCKWINGFEFMNNVEPSPLRLKKRTKEELEALRNPNYEYLIP